MLHFSKLKLKFFQLKCFFEESENGFLKKTIGWLLTMFAWQLKCCLTVMFGKAFAKEG